MAKSKKNLKARSPPLQATEYLSKAPEAKAMGIIGCDADHGASEVHEKDMPRGIRAVAGTISGAGLGFAVAGSTGLAFGGIAGLIIGASTDMMFQSEDE